jgi:hypothetical protein
VDVVRPVLVTVGDFWATLRGDPRREEESVDEEEEDPKLVKNVEYRKASKARSVSSSKRSETCKTELLECEKTV